MKDARLKQMSSVFCSRLVPSIIKSKSIQVGREEEEEIRRFYLIGREG
jgi:hypothetical protein